MADQLIVGVAATPQPWRREFEFFLADHVQGVRVAALHSAADAEGMGVDVVVIDDTLSLLSAPDVAALRARGVAVIGAYDPTGQAGRGREMLDRLGVDAVVPITAGAEALVEAVADAKAYRPQARTNGHLAAPRPKRWGGGGDGEVVVVAGGSDSPGRTEVAIAVAQSLAGRSGGGAVVVDLDVHNPSVARRLGFRLVPNVLDALAATAAGTPLVSAIAERGPAGTGELATDVVAGLANPDDWPQALDVGPLLAAASEQWPYIVVDTGPTVAAGDPRAEAARAALREADHVIACCTATRSGLLRLFDWAADAAGLVGDASVTVALNRAPRDGYRRGEVAGQVAANLPRRWSPQVEYLPHDPSLAGADWDAAPAGRGPFTTAVAALVDRFGPPRAAPRGVARLMAAVR